MTAVTQDFLGHLPPPFTRIGKLRSSGCPKRCQLRCTLSSASYKTAEERQQLFNRIAPAYDTMPRFDMEVTDVVTDLDTPSRKSSTKHQRYQLQDSSQFTVHTRRDDTGTAEFRAQSPKDWRPQRVFLFFINLGSEYKSVGGCQLSDSASICSAECGHQPTYLYLQGSA
ncbi:hypothetical protein L7F22_050471 [Adiantum nelumboides]|nr:hypothetical protein [Adiantum nelumboides]